MNEEYMQDNRRQAAVDKLANASFVLGIISIFSTLCCCPFVFSAIGIILAVLSKGAEKTLRPKAKTGLILSVAGMVVSVVISVFTIALPIFLIRTNPEYKKEFIEQYEESLEENESMLRELYGDEVYNEVHDAIDNL